MRALALATALVGLDRDRGRRVRRADRPPHQIGRDAQAAPYGDQRRADRPAEPRRLPEPSWRTGSTSRAPTGTQIGLCAIDLDRFKEINDVHGHKAGDERAGPAGRADARGAWPGRHGRAPRRRRIRGDHELRRTLPADRPRRPPRRRPEGAAGLRPFQRAGRRQHRRRGLSARRRRRGDARQQCRPGDVPGQDAKGRPRPAITIPSSTRRSASGASWPTTCGVAIDAQPARDALPGAGLGRDAGDHRLRGAAALDPSGARRRSRRRCSSRSPRRTA